MGEGNLLACLVHLFHGRIQVAVCTAETDNQQIGIVCTALHFYIRYGDFGNLLGTKVAHQVMVFGIGGDGTGIAVFLQTAEDVHIALLSGDGPIADTCFGIAFVRSIVVLHFGSHVGRGDGGIVCQFGQLPGAGAIGYKAVGQQYDRGHMLQCNFACHVGCVETACG